MKNQSDCYILIYSKYLCYGTEIKLFFNSEYLNKGEGVNIHDDKK